MALFDFLRKRAPDRSPSDATPQPETFYLNSGVGVAVIQFNEYIAANAAMQHPIVFRALDKLAGSVQQVGWKVQEDPEASEADRRGKSRVIQDLQDLLNEPNDDMTPAMLRYWLTLNYASYGRIPLRVGFSAIDEIRPNGLYPLEARHVQAQFNDRGVITRFEYGQGEDKRVYNSRAAWYNALPNPPRGGFVDQIWKPALKGFQHKDERNSPLRAIGLPAQVIKSLLIRAIETAEGHPNVRYLVTCSRTLTEKQMAALRQHLNQDHGPEGPDAGKVPILQNAGDVVIHTLDNDLSDIHSKMPSDDMARLIFGAFGIPIALAGMGAADGAKFAGNYIESRKAFWEDTIIPFYVNPIFQGMTRMLCPKGVIIAPDYEKIPALIEGRILNMKEAVTIDFLTNTEKRELYGLKPNPAIPEVTPTPPVASNGDGNEA